ncbi:MAG TPA: hypothetical protein PLM53_09995 [Spirochaetota bacterium]|nr:hypothetical protein [Spirochaetota bacterium]HPC41086.1 hypothetical protein [Spirochaetota bacterium]HPL16978.1 hypothetical protein [Spirochaetota bacterium]HQF08801.1 hypothetical protein [Spirochaetota bacterium]HQH97420.1 hypothetical protein [Spirochaetota bacterium]
MLVDVDTNLFSLQVKVTRLVMAVLSDYDGRSADLGLSISRSPDEDPHIVRCSRVYIDPEDDLIKITESGGDEIGWDDIDIAAQYRIAQHLYTHHLAGSLYRSLSS